MANTYVDYTATASQTDFAFSFDYLEDEHVTVSIDGAATTDFSIVTTPSTKIVLDTGATAGQVVRVARYSQPDQNLVDFVNGSVLTESELDRAYLHNRYLAEESAEQNDVSLRVKEGAAGWDGLNKRLLNLANPVDDQDAATKDYVDDVVGSVAVGTLPDDSVTYAKIQEVAGNNVLLGNDNGTNQNVQELTAAEVRTVLNVADGATANTGTVTSVGSGTGLTGGPITGSGTLSIDNGGVDEAQLADNAVTANKIDDNAVTSGKISATDTNFNVTAAGKVGIGKVNSGAYRLEIDGDLLVQDTGDNFPAAIFSGSGGSAIQLNDGSADGQVYNISSNPDSAGRGGFAVGHIASAGAALTITHVSSTATLSTFSTSSAHGLTAGVYGQLTGGAADWNQVVEVVDVPSATTFVVSKLSSSTSYPTTLTPNDSYVPLLIRRHEESSVLYSMIKILGLPKDIDNGGSAGTQPSWLEAGQLWIDTTDNSIKIYPEVTT